MSFSRRDVEAARGKIRIDDVAGLQFRKIVIDRRDRNVELGRGLAQQLRGFRRENMRVGIDRLHLVHFVS
jgi:hypothetical protein